MKQLKLLVLVCLIFFVQACVPPTYKEVNANVDATNKQFDHHFSDSAEMRDTNRLAPILVDNQNSKPQAWLNAPISFHARNMPLAKLVDHLLQPQGVYNTFSAGANSNVLVSLDIKGSLQKALDLISSKTGYAYTVEGHNVIWSLFVTKTFDVSFMPGISKYVVGEPNNTSSGSSSNSSTGNNSSAANDLTSSGQYSSIEGTISLWTDLEATVKNMLSDKGKATISQATTTITVTDYAANVHDIQNYLENMNQSLSRQVALDVRVIEVNLNKDFLYGVDWNLVRSFTSQRYGVDISNASRSQLNQSLGTSAGTMLMSASSGVWNNSRVILNALEQQGKVSVETQPRVVTLNNQVAQIGINTSTTYLAQVSTNVVVQGPTTTTLTPGTVTNGFTLYLLPKIQGDNVYLQISSIISNLIAIQPYPSNGSASVQSGGNQIYAPIIDEKRFNQRTLVPSGATLLLAGFKQLNNTANNNSIFGSNTLGGYGGGQKNVETVILITPTIIHLTS